MQDEHLNWTMDRPSILIHTLPFFQKLFQTNHHKSFSISTIVGSVALGTVDKEDLVRPPLEKEIKETVFSFHPYKASGPDGFHRFFYQKYWSFIGPSVIRLCTKAFQEECIPEGIN